MKYLKKSNILKIKVFIIFFSYKLMNYINNSYIKNLKNKNFIINYEYFINKVVIL